MNPQQIEMAQLSMQARSRDRRLNLSVKAPPKIQTILRQAEHDNGVEAGDILSHRQYRELVSARRQAAQQMRDRLGLSLHTIARYLGGMHHTSVLHLLRKADAVAVTPPVAEPGETIGVCDEWV